MRRNLIVGLLLLSLLVAAGCSKTYKVEVKSDTTWSGAFTDRTIDGEGDSTIVLAGSGPHCINVQKQTEDGYVSIRFVEEGDGPTKTYDPIRTDAAFGVVQGCAE